MFKCDANIIPKQVEDKRNDALNNQTYNFDQFKIRNVYFAFNHSGSRAWHFPFLQLIWNEPYLVIYTILAPSYISAQFRLYYNTCFGYGWVIRFQYPERACGPIIVNIYILCVKSPIDNCFDFFHEIPFWVPAKLTPYRKGLSVVRHSVHPSVGLALLFSCGNIFSFSCWVNKIIQYFNRY